MNKNFLKDELIKKYTDKTSTSLIYIGDGVYSDKSRMPTENDNEEIKRIYEKEVKMAKAFAKEFEVEVFLFPHLISSEFSAIVNYKNPDGITMNSIIEFKQLESSKYQTIKKRLKEAVSQGPEIIYFNFKNTKLTIQKCVELLDTIIQRQMYISPWHFFIVSVDLQDFKSFFLSKNKTLKNESLLRTRSFNTPLTSLVEIDKSQLVNLNLPPN